MQTINLTGITAGPPNEVGQMLTITATSASPGLIPNPTVTYTSPNGTATLTYTPVADQNGTAVITVEVTDDGQTAGVNDFKSVIRTFPVKVNAVNDAPSFSLKASPDVTVTEDPGLQLIAGQAINILNGPPAEATVQHVIFDVSNDNNLLFAANGQPAMDVSGTLKFKPALNINGVATVTVQVRDNGGILNGGVDTSTAPPQTFLITVTPVNDPPTLTTVATLPGATAGTPFPITYATLAAAGNEADMDSSPISFRIETISSGTLIKNGAVVTPGITLLNPGESLEWTSAASASGDKNAFKIKAWDGSLVSGSTIQVKVNVTP